MTVNVTAPYDSELLKNLPQEITGKAKNESHKSCLFQPTEIGS